MSRYPKPIPVVIFSRAHKARRRAWAEPDLFESRAKQITNKAALKKAIASAMTRVLQEKEA